MIAIARAIRKPGSAVLWAVIFEAHAGSRAGAIPRSHHVKKPQSKHQPSTRSARALTPQNLAGVLGGATSVEYALPPPTTNATSVEYALML